MLVTVLGGEVPSLFDLGLNPTATMGLGVGRYEMWQIGSIECLSALKLWAGKVAVHPFSSAISFTRPLLMRAFNHKRRNCIVRFSAKFHQQEDDSFFQAALERASFRAQETQCPDPLFIDPYAGCLIPSRVPAEVEEQARHCYCLATKFIDDKLLSTLHGIDGLKQVVLFTDGMDTRPYRLNWPVSTIIFDISPDRVFERTTQKLKDVGAKVQRGSMLAHVPLESCDLLHVLRSRGFDGNRPSIWAFQGSPIMTLATFKEILFVVSSLSMKGCLFLGELPVWLTETEIGLKSSAERWMSNLFMSSGFHVEMICYDIVARSLVREIAEGVYGNILFIAEHLRYSDDQMDAWRRELQRIEEDGDEEGFEEL